SRSLVELLITSLEMQNRRGNADDESHGKNKKTVRDTESAQGPVSTNSACRSQKHLGREQYHPPHEYQTVKMHHQRPPGHALKDLAEIRGPEAGEDDETHEDGHR